MTNKKLIELHEPGFGVDFQHSRAKGKMEFMALWIFSLLLCIPKCHICICIPQSCTFERTGFNKDLHTPVILHSAAAPTLFSTCGSALRMRDFYYMCTCSFVCCFTVCDMRHIALHHGGHCIWCMSWRKNVQIYICTFYMHLSPRALCLHHAMLRMRIG